MPMREINIMSFIEAYSDLDSELFDRYTKCFGITSAIKDYEISGLRKLVRQLLSVEKDISVLAHYYLGYSIPQIGKEFDLLRFGTDCIINIEIKTDCALEKVLRQQVRNHYYLSFLGKKLLIYTYLSESDKFYRLISGSDGDRLIEVNVNELYGKLYDQQTEYIIDIDNLFNPSDYLVSPFNSTDKFIDGKYFLTVQQENIYNDIMASIDGDTARFMALTGAAGTGKTLLTYHIAKYAMLHGLRVLLLHCGSLNRGHGILTEQYGWEIHMPKYAPDFSDFDIVVIDEAQRMYPDQFNRFVDKINSLNLKCIFAFDANQYLRDTEFSYEIKRRIETELGCKPYRLTDKIRTNREIAYFIKQLFNKRKNIPGMSYTNITFSYCKDYNSTKLLLAGLLEDGWKTPNYTPGTRSMFHYEKYQSPDSDSAHSVVGQEFDKVAIVLDSYFTYDSNGDLKASNYYYSQRQMLYQIITRTRKQLYVIIVNNPLMLNRVIDIVTQ